MNLGKFDKGKHDDQVDATSQLLIYLRDKGYAELQRQYGPPKVVSDWNVFQGGLA